MGLAGWIKDAKDEITLALAVRKAAGALKKEMAMNHDWAKTLRSAGIDFVLTCAAVLVAYLADPVNLAVAMGAVPEHLRLALVPLVSAFFVALRKRLKHGPSANAGKCQKCGMVHPAIDPESQCSGLCCFRSGHVGACVLPPPHLRGKNPLIGLVLLAFLPSLAVAQDPASTPQGAGVEINLHGGAMQFAERGSPDRRDFVYRLTLTVPAPAGATIFARADYTRTQDGGDLLDLKTFRSVEGFAGARRPIAANLEAMALAGVSWDRDANVAPADPRLYTIAGGLRLNVPGRGYAVAAIGHHGPVGGAAALGSFVLDIEASGAAAWFFDVAVPLDADGFRRRPYTAKVGFSARLKGWKF